MSQVLINSFDTVLVYGPTSVVDALACTISSAPSGSVLIRTIPRADFEANKGKPLLDALSDAVEQILAEGTAVAAGGGQGVDPAGLLYDFVRFTVGYTPPNGTPGEITADVDIPVNSLTLDTQFGAFIPGDTPAELINATYQRLAVMAGG